jgi:competence protein ComEC
MRCSPAAAAQIGSRGHPGPRRLDAVRPPTAIISVGEGNPYGHPAPETLDRLDPRPIFRTDLHGDVQITTDGHKLWIKAQSTSE